MRRERELLLPASPPVYLLVGFVVVCFVSVVSLLFNPLDAMTHTYNTGPHRVFALRPIEFSITNMTQLVLRVFAIGAIVGLATVLSQYDVQRVLRLLIVCSLLVGVFGVFYQVTQTIEARGIWKLANAFGLDIQEKSGGAFGFLPRMWTPAGDPGWGASFFLYLFSLTATHSFLPETRVASRKRLRIATAGLFAALILSTSTTAYGGLLVFGAVFLVATVVSRRIATRSVVAVYGALLLGVLLLGGVISMVTGLDVIALLEPQLAKLHFKAGSGTLRLRYIEMAFDLFPQRPLFGAGVGSYFGASLLGTLLAEIGLVGFAAFVLAHVSTYWECLRASRDRIDGQGSVAIALVVSSVVLLGSSLLAKSISTLMFPWFWLSLALPIALSLQSTGRSVSFDRIRQRYGHLTWWDRTQPDR
jgi:O-antigen ligase